MHKFTRFFGFTIALALVIGLLIACASPEIVTLDAPKNVQIDVTGRTMTVTWNAVKNAQGYEILTTSTGCGSGNKLINTKAKTATTLNGSDSYLKNDGSNGAVVIEGKTTVKITLMPATGDDTKPMATAVSAKVKAVGGEDEGDAYLDSPFSGPATKTLGGM